MGYASSKLRQARHSGDEIRGCARVPEIVRAGRQDGDRPAYEPEPELPPEKNPRAVALGRLGGLEGGVARKTKLSQAKRSAIARKAVQARWRKHRESGS